MACNEKDGATTKEGSVYDTGKVKIGLRYDKPVRMEMSDEDIALQNVLMQSVMLDKKQARRLFLYDAVCSVVVVFALAGLVVWWKA